MNFTIRAASDRDHDAIWRIMEPVIRAGETYTLPRNMDRAAALAHWFQPDRTVFVAEAAGAVVGTCYLRANRPGPGGHIANAGFMVATDQGARGVGQALCEHVLAEARRMGFEIVGRVPGAFRHPALGFTDALVMFRRL